MFNMLAKEMTKEMWMRSAVILTFTNTFLELDTVQDSKENEADLICTEIAEFKVYIHKFLSHHVNDKVISEIPFCLAGTKRKRKLPTTNDWLHDLWDACIMRCSDDMRPFLKDFANFRLYLESGLNTTGVCTGIGAGIGTVVSAGFGSIVPIAGTVIGAGVGAGIGAGVGFSMSGAMS